jgi:hypothetical protein
MERRLQVQNWSTAHQSGAVKKEYKYHKWILKEKYNTIHNTFKGLNKLQNVLI